MIRYSILCLERIPKILKDFREKELRVSQEKLAKLTNVSRSTIIRYEKGETTPNIEFLQKLIKIKEQQK